MKGFARALVFALGLLGAPFVQAHKPSDSYLSLIATPGDARIAGQWDIALRDLEHALGVDADGDGEITWGELREREGSIARYAFAYLSVARVYGEARDACPIEFERLLTDQHVDGGYAVLRFHAVCAAPPVQLAVNYSLLFDLDPNHRGLLQLQSGAASQAVVLSQSASEFVVRVNAPQRWAQLRSFIAEGVWHILQGYDHVLFLLTLLLPAVVSYREGKWEPRSSLRDASVDIVKVVTAFTLAHSVTLSIAALGWVSLPSRFVESAIALTVVLGALNNIFPVITERRWVAALAFGLIHGFGFASVLSDLGLERANLALPLLGFNLGVELGQLAIVLVFAPVAYLLRTSLLYRRIVMPAGAILIGAFAAYWFVTRAFGVGAS